MSAELAVPDGTQRGVTGTVGLRHGELVVRVRPDSRQGAENPAVLIAAVTRPTPAAPATLAGVHCMRYVGPCIGAEAVEHHRTVAWCAAHPVLAWLRGWTR